MICLVCSCNGLVYLQYVVKYPVQQCNLVEHIPLCLETFEKTLTKQLQKKYSMYYYILYIYYLCIIVKNIHTNYKYIILI